MLSAREGESLFRQMFERHSSVMLLIDPGSGVIVEANAAAADFYGHSRENLRGMHVSRINAQPESELAPQRQQALSGEKSIFVFDHRLASGEVRAVESHITTINYNDRTLFFSVIHDITNRRHIEEQIRNLAFYDPLTRLPNRRLLSDRLGQTMVASRRNGHHFAFMLLDLDNFKPLNDSHGHAVGDIFLVEVANRLKGCVREIDTLARFGGDEFVVVLGQMSADKDESIFQAGAIAGKIRARLDEVHVLDIRQNEGEILSIRYRCPASIGLVVSIDGEFDEEVIFKRADAAMYLAKTAGGNQVRLYGDESRQ